MTLRRTGLRHPHTGEPLVPVGYRKDGRPILPILGAGPDDEPVDSGDGDELEIDGDDNDEDDDDEDDGDEPFVKEDGKPFTKKDYDALQLALKNARKAERAARRNGRDDKGGKDGDDKGGDDKDVERVRAEIESKAVATWKPLIVNQAARAALVEAGLMGAPDRLLKLLDLDEIDVDPETGEIDGLEEQIEDMRKDYSSLFRKRGGARRIDAGDKDRRERSGKKMSATELQAAALLGDL